MDTDSVPPAGRRPPRPRGRKRDTERTEAILRAAGDLLFERGVDRFRVQDVADRAGCGTGAIYRRWATKESLLAEAVRGLPQAAVPQTGDPEQDFRSAIESRVAIIEDNPDLLPSVINVMRTDPEIAAAAHASYSVEPIRSTLARLIGDDHVHLDLLAELAPALAIHRATLGKPVFGHRSLVDDMMTLVDLATLQDRSGSES